MAIETRPAPLNGIDSREIAKAALRRIAMEKLEPTPENYARAYRLESGDASGGVALPDRAVRLVERLAARAFETDASAGAEIAQQLAHGRFDQAERLLQVQPAVDANALAGLFERMLRGLERGHRGWTPARKKDSLQRVLSGSRADPRRLVQRLGQLVQSWDHEAEPEPTQPAPADFDAPSGSGLATGSMPLNAATRPAPLDGEPDWQRVNKAWTDTIQCALTDDTGVVIDVKRELEALQERLQHEGASTELADEADRIAHQAQLAIAHKRRTFAQLGSLAEELTASLAELAEDDSWVQGQCQAMRAKIEEGLTGRGVRAVGDLLRHTRERQGRLRAEREAARDSLKGLINRMLSELDELGSQTGNFHDSVGRYANVIEQADTLESLAGAVREMVEESRTVHSLVQQTQARLQDENHKAKSLSARVNELESEMRRLSEEVSTDQLTQVANRRGLLQAFEVEKSRLERAGGPLSVGLLDIDNFKRLNDDLGHGAGDEALKSLAALISTTLRPSDRVARYGGEEFVVLLPDTPVEEGRQILTRLQRSLTGGLFMHESKQVFVTFSAGVTLYRAPEEIEQALERADQALYEAKRTGKNRTCVA